MEFKILDQLIDGPLSGVNLAVRLRRYSSQRALDVHRLVTSLRRLMTDGLVRVSQMESTGHIRPATTGDIGNAERAYSERMPWTADSDHDVDEVGLWVEVTEAGRAAWAEWARQQPEYVAAPGYWAIDIQPDERLVEIRASDRALAESVLQNWLDSNAFRRLVPDTVTCTEGQPFVTREGLRIDDGVILRCQYS